MKARAISAEDARTLARVLGGNQVSTGHTGQKAKNTARAFFQVNFAVGQEGRVRVLHNVGAQILEAWRDLARGILHRTYAPYAAAIELEVVSDKTVRVVLPGKSADSIPVFSPSGRPTGITAAALARIVEYGMPLRDLRQTVLKGRDKVVIPFEWGASEVPPRAGGARNAQRAVAKAFRLIRESRAAVLGPRPNYKALRKTGLTRKAKEHHSKPLLAGLRSISAQGPMAKSTQSHFRTFRTMTAAQPASMWQAKVEARHIGDKVAAQLPSILQKVT